MTELREPTIRIEGTVSRIAYTASEIVRRVRVSMRPGSAETVDLDGMRLPRRSSHLGQAVPCLVVPYGKSGSVVSGIVGRVTAVPSTGDHSPGVGPFRLGRG